MPAGPNHQGRTRENRTMLTVPMRRDEIAAVDKAARKAGLSRAEYVRRLVLPR